MTLKHCNGCDENKELTEFHFHRTGKQTGKPLSLCIDCHRKSGITWRKNHPERAKEFDRKSSYKHGSTPMTENKSCTAYLGVVIAETILSREFPGFVRMPYGNPNYDYDCPKGFKIDVKSSCRRHPENEAVYWDFHIKENMVANFFLCIAFGDRDEPLVPEHIWLIPGDVVNDRINVHITDSPKILAKWSKYERPLKNALECCDKMRERVKDENV